MNWIIEEVYTVIEAALIVWFLSVYFRPKEQYRSCVVTGGSFCLFLALDSTISFFDAQVPIALLSAGLLLLMLLEKLYQGKFWEHLLLTIVSLLLLALIDVCVFTLLSAMLGEEYHDLVSNSTSSRFLAVISAKLVYFTVTGVIISVKKRYALLLHKTEYFLISVTLFISGALIVLVRNMIYHSETHYRAFLGVLLCVLLLNIIIYCTMIHISKKNVAEQNMTLIKKQLEMQEESIRVLEESYHKTIKLRHDMKNHIGCALQLAESGEISDVVAYLSELSDEKLNTISGYIKTQRNVIGAVLNTKLSKAEQMGVRMQCHLLSEMEAVSDVDAGILLANLLDNALEACAKNKKPSEIFLKIWAESGYYCLELSNTVESVVLLDNPELKTDKEDKNLHGLGLQSVRDIVSKYEGVISFEQKSECFFVYISMAKSIS